MALVFDGCSTSTVSSNYIGLDIDGNVQGNAGYGVVIKRNATSGAAATQNVGGGTTPLTGGNVISANGKSGVIISDGAHAERSSPREFFRHKQGWHRRHRRPWSDHRQHSRRGDDPKRLLSTRSAAHPRLPQRDLEQQGFRGSDRRQRHQPERRLRRLYRHGHTWGNGNWQRRQRHDNLRRGQPKHPWGAIAPANGTNTTVTVISGQQTLYSGGGHLRRVIQSGD